MRHLKSLALLFVLFYTSVSSAQENFSPKYIPTSEGGKIVFCHDKKQIEVNLFGKQIQDVEANPGEVLPNHYFVAVDKTVIQAVLIPIPDNVRKVHGIKNLTLDQQKEILLGYMDYEIDYLNGQSPGLKDINYAEGNVKSDKHIIWNYFYKEVSEDDADNGEAVIGQFCLSTIVFDQMLTVTVSVSKSNLSNNPVLILKKIAENIVTAKRKCD